MKKIKILLLSILLLLSFIVIAAAEVDLVEIKDLDPTIIIDLKYATEDNFTGRIVYNCNRAYLREEAAESLVKIQEKLREKGLGLKIWDAYRPHSVQYKFWELVPDPRYVADPSLGSNHNRGGAVDVTLVDLEGNELLMPTGFDDFSEKAAIDYYNLPEEAIKNRELLQEYMMSEGFYTIETEWWHFDYEKTGEYDILDIPLEEIEPVVPVTK